MELAHRPAARAERGTSLIELMVALVVLSLGLLAMGQLFPAGSRGQLENRMMTSASYYAQQKIEYLQGFKWSDPELSAGRHPAGAATEDLGPNGQWHRFYQIDILPVPLDNLKRITVTVNWTYLRSRSVSATTYIRR